ncbi:Uncharacterized protein ESCO_006409 [Escovopsis weberi]|uniref:SAP domain-containing protein n=1 Tax=Escovopsis weberi TaxID=150374 RepID=A0A0M9VS42_ESCWE|nr:Uncharacterized protein ESCO_006409 [Escovopsis weberi]
MAEYTSLKVPELKKLLASKNLSQTGNKADLIARLQEDDKKNAAPAAAEHEPEAEEAGKQHDKPADAKGDEITYSDDETASKPAPTAAGKPAHEPAAEPAPAPAPAEAAETQHDDDAKRAEEQQQQQVAASEAASFALGLSSTAAEDEIKKRADRARRFGIEVDDETRKLNERAKRFGIEDKGLPSGLDAALPERSLKRGRGRDESDASRAGKRQSRDRRNGGGGDRRGARPAQAGAVGARKMGSVLDDPTEKAKAEKRAARFAAA